MALFHYTRKFIRCCIGGALPRVKKIANKAHGEFKQIYKEAKEDYENKKREKGDDKA